MSGFAYKECGILAWQNGTVMLGTDAIKTAVQNRRKSTGKSTGFCLLDDGSSKKGNQPHREPIPQNPLILLDFLLAEVALQQAFESLAMTGFVGLPPIKIFATLDFAYNFLQLFYNFESLHCNSFTTIYNIEELSARMLANA